MGDNKQYCTCLNEFSLLIGYVFNIIDGFEIVTVYINDTTIFKTNATSTSKKYLTMYLVNLIQDTPMSKHLIVFTHYNSHISAGI